MAKMIRDAKKAENERKNQAIETMFQDCSSGSSSLNPAHRVPEPPAEEEGRFETPLGFEKEFIKRLFLS